MKRLFTMLLAMAFGMMVNTTQAGLWDSIKKVGSGVADVAGGVVDATVNITTTAVQSVSVDTKASSNEGGVVESPAQEQQGVDSALAATEALAPANGAAASQNVISIGGKRKVKPSRAERRMNRRQNALAGHFKDMPDANGNNAAFIRDKAELRKRLDGFRFSDDFQSIENTSERNQIAGRINGMKSSILALPNDDRNGEGRKKLNLLLDEEKAVIAHVKNLAEQEKAARAAREKAEREAHELAAKRQAEQEAKEKEARELRDKELVAHAERGVDGSSADSSSAAAPSATATDSPSSVSADDGEGVTTVSSVGVGENRRTPVNWTRLLITLGVWLVVMVMGCLVAFFAKKPSAESLPKKVRVCYFISKWDYAPAMLSTPLFLVLLIGFAGTYIGEVWKNTLLLLCGGAVLAMNWWALLKANKTWFQAISLLPMRLVVGILGLFLPVVSAFLGLVSIGLAIQGSSTIRDTSAKISRQDGWASKRDEENLKQGKADLAASGVAGALGAAGGWASKKMWSSIHSRTRSIVEWDAEM